VLLLATDFLTRIAEEEGKPPVTLSPPAAEALKHYSWPGNVRQLENAMRQLVLLGQEGVIDEAAVGHMIAGTEIAVDASDVSMPSAGDSDVPSEGGIEPLWITEKKAIEAAIAASGGSINRAAKQLQVAPSTIYRKIQSWKVQSNSS
jgi:two-component system repressor protein LuxO